jgi:hypothetical protein
MSLRISCLLLWLGGLPLCLAVEMSGLPLRHCAAVRPVDGLIYREILSSITTDLIFSAPLFKHFFGGNQI